MATTTKTKEIMDNFYGNRKPDAEAGGFGDLLPVKAEEGAPDDAKYLMEFCDTEVRKSKETATHPNRAYVSGRLAVVEPEYFEDRGFFTMFYLPVAPDADTKASDVKKIEGNTDRLFGQIDRILGEGTAVGLFGHEMDDDELEAAMESLAEDLEGERIVVEVSIRKPSKVQKEAGYTDSQNAVKQYHTIESWEGEE